MKSEEIRQMNDTELAGREIEIGRELLESRSRHAISQLHDTATLRKLRKDIARIKTELRRRKASTASR